MNSAPGSLRLKRTDGCPLKLAPGEYKRVPLTGPVVGHYIACPKCGFRCMVILASENPGDSDGPDGLTLAQPIKCPRPTCDFERRVVRDGVL